jgi:hypothetical protein
LGNSPGKIESLRNNHFADRSRKVESDMVSEHTYIILQASILRSGARG